MANKKFKRLEWSEDYDLGIEPIDKAHREIFQIVDLLVEKNMQENREAIIETVNFMRDYVMRHFRDEENYMAEIAYKDMDVHKQYHMEFRNRILPAIDRKLTERDYDRESVEEFVSILMAWLSQHIMISDKKIKNG